MHACDVATLFRLALEKSAAGRYCHPVRDGAIPLRELAKPRLGTRQTSAGDPPNLGWEPAQPGLFADLGNGHYFSAN